tara:strand:- start:21914 stop:23107 length:1194 start_codon:yes stop_codon:yes gene_type:complete
MHVESMMLPLMGAVLIILVVGGLIRYFQQPYVVAYIVSGIIMGPFVFEIVSNPDAISKFSDFGVIILLFFLGMEISIDDLLKYWKSSFLVITLQLIISFVLIYIIAYYLNWPISRVVLMSYVICLSSTAVVIKILQEWGEIYTEAGKNIVAILIIQDILLAPMLLTINFFDSAEFDYVSLLTQLFGIGLISVVMYFLLSKKNIKLPLAKILRKDHELQTFTAFFICFGAAFITNLIHLSSGLGAFIGGMIVSSAKETDWIEKSLESLKVLFIAFFFVSVGMMIDLNFVRDNIFVLSLLMLTVFFVKSFTLTVLLRLTGYGWLESLYVGAILSQIGEFSFVLVATGKLTGIVSNYAYQMSLSLITISLLISPLWVFFIKKITTRDIIINDDIVNLNVD